MGHGTPHVRKITYVLIRKVISYLMGFVIIDVCLLWKLIVPKLSNSNPLTLHRPFSPPAHLFPHNGRAVDDVVPRPGNQHRLPAVVKLRVPAHRIPEPLALALWQRAGDPQTVMRVPGPLELVRRHGEHVRVAPAIAVEKHPLVEVVAPKRRRLVHAHPPKHGLVIVDLLGPKVARQRQALRAPRLRAVVPVAVGVDVESARGGRSAEICALRGFVVGAGTFAKGVHIPVLRVVRDADVAVVGLGAVPQCVALARGLWHVAVVHAHRGDAGAFDVAVAAWTVILQEEDEGLVGRVLDDVCAAKCEAGQATVLFLVREAGDPVGYVVRVGPQGRVDGTHWLCEVRGDGGAVRGADVERVAVAHERVAPCPDNFAVNDARVAEVARDRVLVPAWVEEPHSTVIVCRRHLGRKVAGPRCALAGLGAYRFVAWVEILRGGESVEAMVGAIIAWEAVHRLLSVQLVIRRSPEMVGCTIEEVASVVAPACFVHSMSEFLKCFAHCVCFLLFG